MSQRSALGALERIDAPIESLAEASPGLRIESADHERLDFLDAHDRLSEEVLARGCQSRRTRPARVDRLRTGDEPAVLEPAQERIHRLPGDERAAGEIRNSTPRESAGAVRGTRTGEWRAQADAGRRPCARAQGLQVLELIPDLRFEARRLLTHVNILTYIRSVRNLT